MWRVSAQESQLSQGNGVSRDLEQGRKKAEGPSEESPWEEDASEAGGARRA